MEEEKRTTEEEEAPQCKPASQPPTRQQGPGTNAPAPPQTSKGVFEHELRRRLGVAFRMRRRRPRRRVGLLGCCIASDRRGGRRGAYLQEGPHLGGGGAAPDDGKPAANPGRCHRCSPTCWTRGGGRPVGVGTKKPHPNLGKEGRPSLSHGKGPPRQSNRRTKNERARRAFFARYAFMCFFVPARAFVPSSLFIIAAGGCQTTAPSSID